MNALDLRAGAVAATWLTGGLLLPVLVWQLGADPGPGISSWPVPALVWLTLWAAPLGALSGELGPAGLVPGLALVVGVWAGDSPRPAGVWLALVGLWALGVGLAAWAPRGRLSVAGLTLLAGAVLIALPGGAGLTGERAAWSPELAARLLDWSPLTLTAEAGGLDWLRHPVVYGPAGGDAIGPGLRVPHGALAGGVPLLLGCGLALVARLLVRRRPE